MTQIDVNNLSDYNSRTVAIKVTGVQRQKVLRQSEYTVKVPYNRMSQAIQEINRMGGKVVSVAVSSSSVGEVREAGVTYPQLKHKNPKLRERAMRQIAEERTQETIPQLMAILYDEDGEYRRAAVQTLGVIGPDAAPALAEQLVKSDNATVRASCAKALAAIALSYPESPLSQGTLDALQKALYDPNPMVKLASIGALSTVGEPALEILVAALETDDISLSVAAIGALGSLGDARAAEALKGWAENQEADSYIRESAQSALSRLEEVIKMNAAAGQRRSPE